jgi:hypothetical protein
VSIPSSIGRYAVTKLLGTGGFAVVWLAEDDRLHDQVAIKVLAENWAQRLDLRERFEQEARVLRRTKSHRVVDVYDIDELPDGRPYFVMTFADKGSLADLIEAGPLPVVQALRHGADIARGIDDLHGAGVVHRDVKPSNVLFRSAQRDAEPSLLIADLGLARELSRGSRFTIAAGSPGYMAPEQGDPESPVDERTDIYGIGATVYHALTGRHPREPLEAPSALRPGLPPGTDDVVLRAMALDPAERWASAQELAVALDELVGATDTTTPVAASRPVASARRFRRRPLVVAAALAGVVVLAAFAVFQFGFRQTTDSTSSSASPAPPSGLTNCRHAQGTGSFVSADYVRTTTSPVAKIGAIQLCRDSAQAYWAYLVLYSPLPAGQWANAELERWSDGHYDARFTCETTDIGGNGHVTEGRQECWSPKISGTDTNYTFVASPRVCHGVYSDIKNCYVEGHTIRTR